MKTFVAILLCACAAEMCAGIPYHFDILRAPRKVGDPPPKCKADVPKFLASNNKGAAEQWNLYNNAFWDYLTNLVKENKEKWANASAVKSAYFAEQGKEAKNLSASCPNLPSGQARQLKLISMTCDSVSADVRRNVSELGGVLNGIFGRAKVTIGNETLTLQPGLVNLMAKSRDYDKLLSAWKGWRDAIGPQMKDTYAKFVQLQNKGAKENGFSDIGECWRQKNYEDKNFDKAAAKLWVTLEPFYKKLHAYVRRKLMKAYPNKGINATDPIPAHILGNMWSQQWSGIGDIVAPYPSAPKLDVTAEMVRQNYTVMRMFKTAEEFFTSIGLEKMTDDFYNKSMFTKPPNRPVFCQPYACDFHNGQDYRIKMCTVVDMYNLYVIHHEMGHSEYAMQYRNQPDVFRDGANAGFHEAVGDTISLFVLTPNHMQKLGLLNETNLDAETKKKQGINFLMSKALERVAFLPFGYLIDKWRWDVFNGATTKDNYNSKWWDLRLKYQGISPPVARTENDFDPGAKFHVPANVPYIRYFVSYIIQFHFHKALCDAAGYSSSEPIYFCDISADNLNSTAAGNKLKAMLSLGASKPWPDALEILTGSREIDASAMVNYFKPLIDWLDVENKKNGDVCGWEPNSPKC